MHNAGMIREHHDSLDRDVFSLLRELMNVKEVPAINKEKIAAYLTQLEGQLMREQAQHQ